MKQVLVLGRGLAGDTFARKLNKKVKNCHVTVLSDVNSSNITRAFGVGETWYEPKVWRKNFEGKNHSSTRNSSQETGINFLTGQVQEVDLNSRKVKFNTQLYVADELVLALGAKSAVLHKPDLQDVFDPWSVAGCNTLASRLRGVVSQFQNMKTKPRKIVIVGGGVVGVSLALLCRRILDAELSALAMKREVFELEIYEKTGRLCNLNSEGSRVVASVLRKQGVSTRLHAELLSYNSGVAQLGQGVKEGVALVLWAAGGVASGAGDPLKGRVAVDRYFQVRGFEEVYCIGDQAIAPFPHRLPSRKMVMDEGEYLARLIAAKLQNKHLPDFSPKEYPVWISLGSWKALRIYRGEVSVRRVI